jgi:choline transporter-like protein 2/4/5
MGREITKETVQDGAILTDRKCTDICMIIFAMLFIAGWIVVGYVAINNGRPSRIVLPENFRGDLCGDNPGPLQDVTYLYIPKPSRTSYGLCTPKCPKVGDYVCNNDIEGMVTNVSKKVRNDYYNHNAAEFDYGKSAFVWCNTRSVLCNSTAKIASDRYTGLLVKLQEYKCFFVFYTTGSTLFRCLPTNSDNDNATAASEAGESKSSVATLGDKTGASAFFQRGFAEMEQTWVVILICGLSAMLLSIIWIILLRCILAPVIYLCILLIFALLIAIGYFAMLMADDLENVKLPGDTATDNQVKIWRAIQWGFWIAAGIYFVVMIWMLKRIKIGIAVMKEGTKAFSANLGLVIIPPIVFIMLIGWVVFFIWLSLYIQTIGEISKKDFTVAATDAFGSRAVNASLSAINSTDNALASYNITSGNTTVNTTEWTTSDYIKALHAYNFFGFLWASNFCIMWGFWIMAMATTVWYFSASTEELDRMDQGLDGGRNKTTPIGTMCKSFCASLRYHLGTILWGSLLIAIIQFIRFIFLYIEEEFLNDWKESATVRCVIYCVNCCLAYIERVIKIISKNGFIINCITSDNFCTCAGAAVGLLVDNCARVGILSMMSTIACFVLKLFIVACNCVIAWVLINRTELTDDRPVESGLFPLTFIFVLSFIIASLFVNVYESCTDTVMMCFLWDERNLKGAFMPISLSKLVDQFGAAEAARKDYEKKVRDASDGNAAEPAKDGAGTKNLDEGETKKAD